MLAVNIAAAASIPLASRHPDIGATTSLILCWIALAVPGPCPRVFMVEVLKVG